MKSGVRTRDLQWFMSMSTTEAVRKISSSTCHAEFNLENSGGEQIRRPTALRTLSVVMPLTPCTKMVAWMPFFEMTRLGLEPRISGSGGRRLIH